jgi:hypothetical protein
VQHTEKRQRLSLLLYIFIALLLWVDRGPLLQSVLAVRLAELLLLLLLLFQQFLCSAVGCFVLQQLAAAGGVLQGTVLSEWDCFTAVWSMCCHAGVVHNCCLHRCCISSTSSNSSASTSSNSSASTSSSSASSRWCWPCPGGQDYCLC